MDWMSGAGSLISAIGGLASAGMSAAQANKQDVLLRQQKAKNDSWFNKEYYQNALDRSENAHLIKELSDNAKQRTKESRARAAVLGSTPEVALAEQQNINNMYAKTAGEIARGETMRKASAYDKYNQTDSLYTEKELQRHKDKAEALGKAAENSLTAIGELLKIGDVAGAFRDTLGKKVGG